MDNSQTVACAGASDSRLGAGLDAELRELREMIKANRSAINDLEVKLVNLEPFQRTLTAQRGSWAPDARTEITEETGASTDINSRDYMFLKASSTIPLVRECTFAEFKNRFTKKEGRYAVDVFNSGQLMHQEMQEEYRLRDRLFESKAPAPLMKIVNDKTLASVVKNATATDDMIQQAQQTETWPRRIRIQSPALLRILARVNRETWSDRPRTYYRPFNSIIHHHARVKEALEELESKWGACLPPDSDDEATYIAAGAEAAEKDSNAATADAGALEDDDEGGGGSADGGGSPLDVEEDEGEDEQYQRVANCPKALECLRAYVKYIDHKIMPDYRRFETLDVNSNAVVRFSDLWFLFRTGELVYRQVEGELPDRRDFRTGKHIWKAHKIISVPERIAMSATDDTEIRDSAVGNDNDAFTIECFYIDYTGEEFCVVTKTFEIEQYSGEVPVNSLPIFPMRFCQDYQGRQRHAEDTGRSLLNFIKTKHCSYNGWTLTHDPSGDATTDVNGVQQQQPEHINSEVMVDFGEAFQNCPAWRPPRNVLRMDMDEGLTLPDDFRVRWWSGKDRARLLGETTELIPVKSGVAARQYNKFIKEDHFLQAVSENAKRARPTKEADLHGDSLALLTGRVFAYVFQERKFAQLSVAKLLPSPKTGLALDSLKIPPTVKRAIQGSVQGHLRKKAAERKMDRSVGISLDLIQGKGTGLFILLHGVPGVGKTATAEAIAQANGKPLFSITVGDLGMTPDRLETSLREIFRLASIWDCILLLDEVDTFFSQRSRGDTAVSKNAMVSVFLRVLDYYDGILFLTTNRAGVLDEAFKSRIHYTVYYPDLSLEQTLDIWRLNIQRVRQMEVELSKAENRPPLKINDKQLLAFAERHFTQSNNGRSGTRWNGRQIRNVFQVALSLAYFEYHEEEGEKTAADGDGPLLDVKHFETMHHITASFENYRSSVRDATDAELALHTETRNDRFSDNLTRNLQNEYRELSLREAQEESAGLENASDVGGGDAESGSRVGIGLTGNAVSYDATSPTSDQTRLHPGAAVPTTTGRPRSSSQQSSSSPPNVGQWRGRGQGLALHQSQQRPSHIPSRDNLDGSYPPIQTRSPNSFGSSFSGSPGLQQQQNFYLASGGSGNLRTGRNYYADTDRIAQPPSNTPRRLSPGLVTHLGGRAYVEQMQQPPPRELYDMREQLVGAMPIGSVGGGGQRNTGFSWGEGPDSFAGMRQGYADSSGPGEGGHSESPGMGRGMAQGFGVEPETDLVADHGGGYS